MAVKEGGGVEERGNTKTEMRSEGGGRDRVILDRKETVWGWKWMREGRH